MAKAALDDHFAAGTLTVAQLRLMRRRFNPADLSRERLSRDEKLREAIAERRRYLRGMPVKTVGQNTRAAVMRVLTDQAEKSGELVERDGRLYIRVSLDRRTTAERSAKSKGAVNRAIKALEDELDALQVDNVGRRAEKAGSFLLPIAQKGTHNGGRGAQEEKETQEEKREKPLSLATYARGGYPSALSDEIPALRWSKTTCYWEWEGSTRKLADYFHVPRLGEKRGQILRHVLEDGGSSSVEDLMERFAGKRTRPWDFRRRMLGPLVKAGILEEVTGGVTLTRNWREALEREREDKDELQDAERQRKRHAEQRRKYREHLRNPTEADKEPGLKGKEHTRGTIERNRPRWQQERVEAERRKVGVTCESFVRDTLARLGKIRYGLLRDMWAEEGGKRDHVRFAIKKLGFRLEKLPEYGNETFVFPVESLPSESREQSHARDEAPAPVIPIRPDTAGGDGPEEWRSHSLDCECLGCSAPMPQYVALGGLR